MSEEEASSSSGKLVELIHATQIQRESETRPNFYLKKEGGEGGGEREEEGRKGGKEEGGGENDDLEVKLVIC